MRKDTNTIFLLNQGGKMIPDLKQFKDSINKENIIFCFCGPISQVLMAEIGDMLKLKMKQGEAGKNRSKVFSILVEQVQNIIHYSDEKYPVDSDVYEIDQLSVGIIAVGLDENACSVMSGNRIKNQKIHGLQRTLQDLQKMDKEELKAFYKKQLRSEPLDDSKGAGLGFIEIARKTNYPIKFDFTPIDETYSFFTIKTMV